MGQEQNEPLPTHHTYSNLTADDEYISPPTYEQSTHPHYSASSPGTPKLTPTNPLTLPAQLSTTRDSLITTLLRTHINPHLQRLVAAGLSRTTLILVPSTTTAFSPPTSTSTNDPDPSLTTTTYTPTSQIVNLPFVSSTSGASTDDDQDRLVAIIHLSGPSNSIHFWSQEAVIRDLERTLKASLAAGGHRVRETEARANDSGETAAPPLPLDPSPYPSSASSSKKSSFWSRNRPARPPTPSSPVSTSVPPLPSSTSVPSLPLSPNEVLVSVSLREVGLRSETEMGLWETRSGKVVVVAVEIGV